MVAACNACNGIILYVYGYGVLGRWIGSSHRSYIIYLFLYLWYSRCGICVRLWPWHKIIATAYFSISYIVRQYFIYQFDGIILCMEMNCGKSNLVRFVCTRLIAPFNEDEGAYIWICLYTFVISTKCQQIYSIIYICDVSSIHPHGEYGCHPFNAVLEWYQGYLEVLLKNEILRKKTRFSHRKRGLSSTRNLDSSLEI